MVVITLKQMEEDEVAFWYQEDADLEMTEDEELMLSLIVEALEPRIEGVREGRYLN